jgi:hypothetical protein
MTTSHRTFLALAIVPGLLAINLLAPADSWAGGAKVVSPFATQIVELHATAKLLHEAKHDYKGHRAQALHQIHLAVHILNPVHKKPKAPSTITPVGTPPSEPQSVSDALLRQALDQLKVVRGQLGNAPPQALVAVRSAITQLETALAIK